MKKKELRELAYRAGYVLGQMIVPHKCYTLTNINTRRKYLMNVRTKDLVRILQQEGRRVK